LLLGDGPCSGDWRADFQRVLGVSAERIGGFVKGCAGQEPLGDGDGDDYSTGHRCGLAVLEDMRRGREMTPQGSE